jgi:hypothetical protein
MHLEVLHKMTNKWLSNTRQEEEDEEDAQDVFRLNTLFQAGKRISE